MDNYDNYRPEIPYTDDLPPAAELNRNKGAKDNNEAAKAKRVKKPREKKKKEEKVTPEKSEGVLFTSKIKNFFTAQSTRLIVGIFLGCLCVYLGVSFLSYLTTCITDQSMINRTDIGYAGEIANTGGEGGARLSEFLINESFGLGSFVIVLWLGAMALKLLVGKPRFKSVDFTIKCIVALITVSLIIGLATISFHTPVNWGGFHGRYVNEFIIHFVGGIGAFLLCVFMIAVFVVICLRDLINWIIRLKRKRDERRRILAQEKAERMALEEEMRRSREQERQEDIKSGESLIVTPPEETEKSGEELTFSGYTPIYSLDSVDELPEGEAAPRTDEALMEASEKNENNEENIESTSEEKEASSADVAKEKSEEKSVDEADKDKKEVENNEMPADEMVVNVNQISDSGKKHYSVGNSPADNFPYKFPPYDILRKGAEKISVDAEEQLENKERIQSTLLDFGIPITRIEATVGPTVTLYEIVPDKGVKISKIRSLVDDIALSLAAKGVRIIAPIPGKGTVGIEVANKDPQVVSMRTIIQSSKFQESKYVLPIAIGSTISNDVYIADLAKMPHLLVAGATGQGKSVGLNAIIASLLYCKRPNELKFVMIDPKQVEFSLYNKIKDHYMAVIPSEIDEEPVITDMQKVEATLNSLCIEMDNRYNLLKNAHTRNIEEYNTKYKAGKLNPEEGHRFLPYIVVVVDEFGDLIMVSGKNVEMPIARLAQKARAVGMHVIIATQRPSTNVITGIIKANFPARMSFKVSSGVDSKTILDTTGAQQLIGRGDMLIFNSSEMVRVQCAFIDTPEVEEICSYVEAQPHPQGVYLLPEPVLGDGDAQGGGEAASSSELDPLFEEVARLVVNSNTASTSSLQRRYSIGYNRAGKIMDQLEAHGIVGPSQGGKPRNVLVDPIGLENILSTIFGNKNNDF